MEPSMTSDNTLSADWDWNFPVYVLRMDRRALEKPRVLALVLTQGMTDIRLT